MASVATTEKNSNDLVVNPTPDDALWMQDDSYEVLGLLEPPRHGQTSAGVKGAVRLRNLILQHADAYATNAHRLSDRRKIVMSIVDRIHETGGRFLREILLEGNISHLGMDAPGVCGNYVTLGTAVYAPLEKRQIVYHVNKLLHFATKNIDSKEISLRAPLIASWKDRFATTTISDRLAPRTRAEALLERTYNLWQHHDSAFEHESKAAEYFRSTTGKLTPLVAVSPSRHDGIVHPALPVDVMMRLAESFFQKQDTFTSMIDDTELIDWGWHFTTQERVPSIRQHGLLTREEMDARGISYTPSGESMGAGIYITYQFELERACSKHDAVGFLMLRLAGKPKESIEGTNVSAIHRGTVTLLKTSDQLLPVMQFNFHRYDLLTFTRTLDYPSPKTPSWLCPVSVARRVWECKMDRLVADLRLDTKRADENINMTAPLPVGPHEKDCVPTASFEKISYSMPASLLTGACLPETAYAMVVKSETKSADSGSVADGGCAICKCPLQTSVAPLVSCGHEMHLECLQQESSKCKSQCPVCHEPFVGCTPRGSMPSGTMKVTQVSSLACKGYAKGTLVIKYTFPRGIQASYHQNPGKPYSRATRYGFLPDTSKGRQLLARLQQAFRRGLTFTVGTAVSFGHENIITWAGIPHKTTTHSGGVHGFPDALYLDNCHAALDALHVGPAPASDALLDG